MLQHFTYFIPTNLYKLALKLYKQFLVKIGEDICLLLLAIQMIFLRNRLNNYVNKVSIIAQLSFDPCPLFLHRVKEFMHKVN
ncbi:hypothetical protein HanPSC8_Chr11g0488741 [Helianthus annuus]|nr:hypothetical protein HanPSC8_Chr11g0488741 [Helianthus annuus]